MNTLVDNPHQKMIFELHNSPFGDYLVELIRIKSDFDNTIPYPRCTKSQGLLPNQVPDEEEPEITDLVLDEDDELEGLTEYDADNT